MQWLCKLWDLLFGDAHGLEDVPFVDDVALLACYLAFLFLSRDGCIRGIREPVDCHSPPSPSDPIGCNLDWHAGTVKGKGEQDLLALLSLKGDSEIDLAQGEGMSEVQLAIHVGIGKGSMNFSDLSPVDVVEGASPSKRCSSCHFCCMRCSKVHKVSLFRVFLGVDGCWSVDVMTDMMKLDDCTLVQLQPVHESRLLGIRCCRGVLILAIALRTVRVINVGESRASCIRRCIKEHMCSAVPLPSLDDQPWSFRISKIDW